MEWGAVQATLEGLRPAFKADSCPSALLTDLMTLADECAAWWDSRNRSSSGAESILIAPYPTCAGAGASIFWWCQSAHDHHTLFDVI